MPKSAPIQASINLGEISPLLLGRVDFDKYKTALKTCLNHVPLVQGPVTRRPGTTYVATVKDSTKATRLVRFVFSTTQSYVLEFGNLYVRVYANHGRVESPPGTPVEIVTPYTAAELFGLMFTQSADTLYIAHPSHKPATLSRTSDILWTYAAVTFTDGPYLNQNITTTTATPAGAGTGDINFTFSSTTGVNGGTGFTATDVGRMFRCVGANWGWGTIKTVTDTTHITVTMTVGTGGTAATTSWRLGVWSDTTGYPGCTAFYQDRLGWSGSTAMPESIYLSVTGNYVSHQPTAYDTAATVIDSHALSFTLNSDDVQVIRWMSGDANGLLVGTVAGEWAVSPSSLNEALTPTNVNAKQMTAYGNANVRPIRVGYVTLALQKSLRKLRELTFVYYENRYHAPDMTVLAQHVTLGGVVELAYQQEPNSIVWAPRADGTLCGFTYERDQNVLGWHRHTLGGTSAKVESVACITAPDGLRDEAWLLVNRQIGGATVRTVEYMNKLWEPGDTVATSVYFDCSLTYNGAPASTITGLTHLIGETVSVIADGAAHPNCVVDGSGHITLTRSASIVTAGYAYNSDGQTLRNDAGAADGTAQGKTQRKHRVTFRLLDTLGFTAGPDFDNLVPAITRTTADDLGAAVPLFTGDLSDTWEGDYSLEDLVCWRFSGGFPGTVQAVLPQQFTFDR